MDQFGDFFLIPPRRMTAKRETLIPPRVIAIGKGSLLVESEHFINGYQAGHLAFHQDRKYFPITYDNMLAILKEQLDNPEQPETYNIGYCVGWIAALATKGGNFTQEPGVSVPPPAIGE